MTLFDQAFLAGRPGRVSRRQLTEEMVHMILYGVAPRTPAEATPSGGSGSDPAEPASLTRHLVDRLIDAERRAARAELELQQLRGLTSA